MRKKVKWSRQSEWCNFMGILTLKLKMNQALQDNCARIFAILDPDGRGVISRGSVAKGLQLLHGNPTDEEIQNLLNEYDREVFAYEDFVNLMARAAPLGTPEERKEDLRVAFTVFDKANSGCIDKALLFDILTKYGHMQLDEGEAWKWLERLDCRKDGKIRIAELEELLVSDNDVIAALQEQKWELV